MTMDFTSEIRANMEEKYGWASRSIGRMTQASHDDPPSIQDHFWSFLHARQLIWYYFANWRDSLKLVESTSVLTDLWKQQNLTQQESQAWDQLRKLRDSDVHIEPVIAREPRGSHLLRSKIGFLCSRDGHLLRSAPKPFHIIQVIDKGKNNEEIIKADLFPLCDLGLSALRKFVDSFDSI